MSAATTVLLELQRGTRGPDRGRGDATLHWRWKITAPSGTETFGPWTRQTKRTTRTEVLNEGSHAAAAKARTLKTATGWRFLRETDQGVLR